MKNVTTADNILVIDGVEIPFKYKITKFIEINNVVAVRLEVRRRTDDINNIYGVIDGKIAWRVQSMQEYNSAYDLSWHDPYTRIDVYDKNPELIIATTFGGYRFLINPHNGKIVGKESWVK